MGQCIRSRRVCLTSCSFLRSRLAIVWRRTVNLPRLVCAAHVRQAEEVEGLRFPLATPLAPFACPTPKLNEARLVRVQFEVEPVESFPQVAQKLLGVVFVLEADNEIVTVSHDNDVSPCVPAAPLARPRGQRHSAGRGSPGADLRYPLGASLPPAVASAHPPARPP